MDGATGLWIIKNAVPVTDLHLYHRASDPPVTFLRFLSTQGKCFDHPLLVALIKGNGGFAVAAETATGTFEYIGNLERRGGVIAHSKKKAGPRGPAVSMKRKVKKHRQSSVADNITEDRNINPKFLRRFLPLQLIGGMKNYVKVSGNSQPTVVDQFTL